MTSFPTDSTAHSSIKWIGLLFNCVEVLRRRLAL
jgi:hypothetical protein